MPIETLIAPESAEDTSFNPSELEPPDGDQLLKDVSAFIGRYLQCSEHQRTILALWTLHTHSLPAAEFTPYLSIQSAEQRSGKSLCLQLLGLLCEHPTLTASFTANALTRRLDDQISTILLDECQAVLGTRTRSRAPVLRAILASGFQRGIGDTDSKHERNTFSPKAFAGMGQLPEALAHRSIPIILQRPNAEIPNKNAACNAITHAQTVVRFNLRRASAEARPLQERLSSWAAGNLPMLKEMPSYSREDFPVGLSPRRQDMIEPLLRLADFIGAGWPSRIREALIAAFGEEAAFELRLSLQLLADIRDCFAHHNYAQRLSSATLLDWMHTRPARPWDVDGPITARTIARLLAPFEIHPRVQRIPGSPTARGYQIGDFKEHWKTHFNFEVPPRLTYQGSIRKFQTKMLEQSQLKISNKDAACNAVTHPENARVGGSPGTLVRGERSELRREPKANSQEPNAEILPNKDAVCNAVTHPNSIPEISVDQRQSAVKNPDLPVPPQNLWQNGHNIAQPASL